ncbi:MAG: hypothetical protein M3209_13375 [Acidobacteriota bacterium]|nr:hypothetical protein [Acidobacteriota bacterium]
MKKVLILPVLLASAVFTFGGSAQAATSTSVAGATAVTGAPQIVRYRRNRNNRIVRTYTTTRLERRGNRVFRVTYQITQRPNGRTVTRMINRVRIR